MSALGVVWSIRCILMLCLPVFSLWLCFANIVWPCPSGPHGIFRESLVNYVIQWKQNDSKTCSITIIACRTDKRKQQQSRRVLDVLWSLHVQKCVYPTFLSHLGSSSISELSWEVSVDWRQSYFHTCWPVMQTCQLLCFECSLLRLVETYYGQAKITVLSQKHTKDDTLNALFLMRERELESPLTANKG